MTLFAPLMSVILHYFRNFVTLSSAFDTVDHHMLLKRLEISFGLQSSPSLDATWLVGFKLSALADVNLTANLFFRGVSQGSVLGPLLFILYTADVEKLIRSLGLDVHLYADDTQQYCNGKPSVIADLKQKTVRSADQVHGAVDGLQHTASER
jgi:Reverse transcriptase (RNA-dependent DNA polymerase)